MRALSIRQPYAELILRGIKTVEYRSQPTRIIGKRFWIYASKSQVISRKSEKENAPAVGIASLTSDNLQMPTAGPPDWMLELAEQIKLIPAGMELPRGVIVGSAVIDKVVPLQTSDFTLQTFYAWHLADVQRATRLRKPRGHPQPVWFRA